MTHAPSPRAQHLRDQMVDHITNAGPLRSERIEQALRTVPRHQFVPATPQEDAYANRAITIKPGEHRPASCASVPTVVATMLGQLDPDQASACWRSVPAAATTPPCWPNSSATPGR